MRPVSEDPREDGSKSAEDGERGPDLHLDRLEELARRVPAEIARRTDEALARADAAISRGEDAIARAAPGLAPVIATTRLRRRVRRRTVALFVMLGLMALLASAWAALRETTILREAMEAQLSARFGGEVSIRSVQWDGWDRVSAKGLQLRAKGWSGDAGRVASMRSAEVVFSPWKLLLGRIELVDMEIDGLVLRLIERRERPGEFSVFALRPTPGKGSGLRQPSSALLRDLELEFGQATGDAVASKVRLRFDAKFRHSDGDASVYEFELLQTDRNERPVGADSRIRLTGTWNERDFAYDATLDGFPIDDRILDCLPMRAKAWAQRSALQGRVERARISGTPERPVRQAEVVLRDVRLEEQDTMRELEWGRIEGGKVTAASGKLVVELGEAELTIRGPEVHVAAKRGTVTPGTPGDAVFRVPVEVDATLDLSHAGSITEALDAEDRWLERALAITPFTLDLRMPGLDARGAAGADRPVELPREAADALVALGAGAWAADVDVRVRRGPPRTGDDGQPAPSPIEVGGTLDLLDGRIRHPDFDYEVTGVKGRIELRGDRLLLRKVAVRGAGTTRLEVDGDFDLSGPDPGWSMRVRGSGVQLDRSLARAFREPPAKTIFDSLLDDEAWRSMHAAGLVDESTRPGGTADCSIEVRHERGGGDETVVDGRVDLRDVNFVLDSFPYPMRGNGTLTVSADGVVMDGEGIEVTTIVGGKGHIDGEIKLPRVNGKRIIRTYVDFDVAGDRVNPALLAAIPPTFESQRDRPAGWPGSALAPISEMLRELGISARLDAHGTVITRADESDAVTTTVRISEGTIVPTEDLARVLRENGLSWPGRMTLESVGGTVIADAEAVRIDGARAEHRGGTARAQGWFAPDGRSGTLEVDLRGFPLERELVRIADGPATDSALQAWDALTPAGTFDAEVAWNRDGEWQDTYAHVRPLSLTLAGAVGLRPECGDLYYRNGELRLDSFDLRGPDTDDTPLRIEAHGTVMGARPDFHASVSELSVSSPIVASALRAADATGAADALGAWRMEGSVDARIDMPGPVTGLGWELVAEPNWVRGERDERPFELRRQSGAVVVGPGTLALDALVLSVDRGMIRADGRLGAVEGSLVGELTLDLAAAGGSTAIPALLPATARRALEAIEFSTDGPMWSTGLRVGVDIPREGAERITVTGDLGMAGGRFLAGVVFEGLDGSLAFDIASEGGKPVGTIGFEIDQVMAVGRRVTTVDGAIVFDRESEGVDLEGITGSLLGGRVAGRGRFHPVDGWEVRASCANVDFARFAAAGDGAQAEPAGDEGHGSMRGRIDLRGVPGDPDSRRGAGRLAVEGARMMEFPLGMSFLQLTQLMLPLNASMREGTVDFELEGGTIRVRELMLACETLRIEGGGEVRTADGALALRLRNRGTLPLLSDLYGVVADQFFAIDVGGTLDAPEPRLTPVPVLAPRPETAEAAGGPTPTEKQ
jgi:hypothetical protein